MYVNRKFNLQEFLILPPLDLVVKLNICPGSTYRSLETNCRFYPARLADLGLNKQTCFQGAAFQNRSTTGGKLLASFEMVNLNLFKGKNGA